MKNFIHATALLVLPLSSLFGDELIGLWHFNNRLDDITIISGTNIHANADHVKGRPYVEMFDGEIDSNGSDGTDFTDVRGIFHDSPVNNDALRWDDISDGSAGDGELIITVNTLGWEDITLRLDVRNDRDNNNSSHDMAVAYSLNSGLTWTTHATLSVTDNNTYEEKVATFFSAPVIENRDNLKIRLSIPSGSNLNSDVYIDNIQLSGDRVANNFDQPAIVVSSSTTNRLDVETYIASQVTTAAGDPTDPLATEGIVFNIVDLQGDPITFSTSSSHSGVVPISNINITNVTGSVYNMTVEAAAEGYATVTLSAEDNSGNISHYYLDVAASEASPTPDESRFHAFQADASTAIDAGPNHMIVADDENQTLRLYHRTDSGVRLASYGFNGALGLTVNDEADLEGSYRSSTSNHAFWIGSHSNASNGGASPSREILFATRVFNSGESTILSFSDSYADLENDLVNWDNSNGHGLGVAALGLFSSSNVGVVPESSGGFNIEGLAEMPAGAGGAYVGFRAPLSLPSGRTHALIIPVTNFESIAITGNGPATFGAPIELDLGGRGIRSMERLDDDSYLIIAGPVGSFGSFALYHWDGNSSSTPALLPTDINARALYADSSPEGLIGLPSAVDANTEIQIIQDGGDANLYGDAFPAKKHPQRPLRKFRSDIISIPAQTDTFIVTNTADSGNGSLRNAIESANDKSGRQTIQFDFGGSATTIPMLSQALVNDDLTIEGDPDLLVTLSGNLTNRLLRLRDGADVEINHLRFIDGASSADGGVINIDGGSLFINRSEFDGNEAADRGGALSISRAEVLVCDSTFAGNIAGSNGGAINLREGSILNLTQSTLSGNEAAKHGGGIFAVASDLRIINSTITDNTADTSDEGFDGGGIRRGTGSATVFIGNSIVAGNKDASTRSEQHPDVSGDFITLGNNLIGDAMGSTGFRHENNGDLVGSSARPLDPLLGNLQVNNGPLKTHRTSFGSPAVEGGSGALFGDEAWGGKTPEFDQDGEKRVLNALPDIGAIEYVPIEVDVLYSDTTASESPKDNRTGTLQLSRSRTFSSLSVTFGVVNQNGSAGLGDFSLSVLSGDGAASGNTVFFPAGVSSVEATLIPVDDTMIEGEEPLRLRLNEGTYHVRGTQNPIIDFLIDDNDILVTSFGDSGPGSLREAVTHVESAGGGRVTFDHTSPLGDPVARVIELSSPINISEHTVIEGSSNTSAGVTVDGGGKTQLFRFSRGADATLRNLLLTGGTALSGGAVYAGGDAKVSMEGSTFTNNSANSDGGAIYSESTSLIAIRNSTLSGNAARRDGGGIAASKAKLSIISTTITENTADSDEDGNGTGGGIATTDSDVEIGNSILAANFSQKSSSAQDVAGALTTLTGNLVGQNDGNGAVPASMPAGLPNTKSDFVGTAKSPVDPRLHPLRYLGGATPVHHPGFGSLALDNASAGLAPADDQRGLPRPFNGTPDIGAVEHQYLDYAYWQEFSFPPNPRFQSQYAADLDWDDDGLSSGLERIFDTDPTDSNRYKILDTLVVNGELVIVFNRAMWVAPSDVGGEASFNLQKWGSKGLIMETAPLTDSDSLNPEMHFRIPLSSDTVFGRILDQTVLP